MSKIDINIIEIRKQASIISGQHAQIRIAKDLLDSSRRNLTCEIRNRISCDNSLYSLSQKLQKAKDGNNRIGDYIVSAAEDYSEQDGSSYTKNAEIKSRIPYGSVMVENKYASLPDIENFEKLPKINEYLKNPDIQNMNIISETEKEAILEEINLLFDYTDASNVGFTGAGLLFSGSSTLVNKDEVAREIINDSQYGDNYSDHLYSLKLMFNLDYEKIDNNTVNAIEGFVDKIKEQKKLYGMSADILDNKDIEVQEFLKKNPGLGKSAKILFAVEGAVELSSEILAILLMTPNTVYNELLSLKSAIGTSTTADEGLITAIDHLIDEFDDKEAAFTKVMTDYVIELGAGKLTDGLLEMFTNKATAIAFDLVVTGLGETYLNKKDELTNNLLALKGTNNELQERINYTIDRLYIEDFESNLATLNELVEASKKNKIAETELIMKFIEDNSEKFSKSDDVIESILNAGEERINDIEKIDIMKVYGL